MANVVKHDLDDKKREEIKKLIALGVPKTKIAKQFAVTYSQLNYFLSAA